MKIPYKQEVRICSLNVRGMKESAKREQSILQMIRHRIDIACIQETHIHDSSFEAKDKHSFAFSSNALNKKADWGVGFCFRNGFGPRTRSIHSWSSWRTTFLRKRITQTKSLSGTPCADHIRLHRAHKVPSGGPVRGSYQATPRNSTTNLT